MGGALPGSDHAQSAAPGSACSSGAAGDIRVSRRARSRSLSKGRLRGYEEMDEIGRPIEIKIIGRWALTFWSDHAVREVKVIRVEKADRD